MKETFEDIKNSGRLIYQYIKVLMHNYLLIQFFAF